MNFNTTGELLYINKKLVVVCVCLPLVYAASLGVCLPLVHAAFLGLRLPFGLGDAASFRVCNYFFGTSLIKYKEYVCACTQAYAGRVCLLSGDAASLGGAASVAGDGPGGGAGSSFAGMTWWYTKMITGIADWL